MAKRNNGKANTNTNAVAVVNISSDTMLASVINETDLQVARESNEVENVGTAVLNPKLRDYYTTAYDKLNKLEGNVLLAKRKMIVAIMDSEDYKQSFANDKDFAAALGESQTAISKAKSCITTLKWLTDNGFGSDWTSSQLDEITPTLNKELKADKAESFKTMIQGLFDKGAFNASMSSRQIRDIMANLLEKYNELYPPVKTESESQETESDSHESDNSHESKEAETKADNSDYDICKVALTLTMNNGMSVVLDGTCKKGAKKGDNNYQIIQSAIMENEKLKSAILKLVQQFSK